MKASLIFVTLTLLTASLPTMGMSELEQLRNRCAAQEEQIRKLEAEVKKLQPAGSAAKSGSASQASSSGEFSSYTVKKGDSLGRIASRHKTTPEAIARMNRLKMNSVIHPGQKLRVPGGGQSSPVSTAAATAVPDTYKVREGDTYSSISRQTGIPVSSLMSANPRVKATEMRPGQTIRLVRGGPAAAAEPKAPVVAKKETKSPAPASEPKEADAAPSPAPAPEVPAEETPASLASIPSPAAAESTPTPEAADRKIRPVMIDGEMTYGEFASQHGTDIDRLNDLNGLDLTSATVLARGSELYVPAQP